MGGGGGGGGGGGLLMLQIDRCIICNLVRKMSSVSIKSLSMCSHVNCFCFVSGLNNNNNNNNDNNNNLKMLINPWCSHILLSCNKQMAHPYCFVFIQ